jgi:hypothetical protein
MSADRCHEENGHPWDLPDGTFAVRPHSPPFAEMAEWVRGGIIAELHSTESPQETTMKRALIALSVAVPLAFAGALFAQEHPEHPRGKAKGKAAHAYSMDEVAKAITAEIETAQKKNDGVYKMDDKDANRIWTMKLDHVHRERLARLDPKTYFACTDFKSEDGRTVDVDFFMKDDGEKLVMSDATIHKVDGVPRYNWQEKDGYWVRIPVEK